MKLLATLTLLTQTALASWLQVGDQAINTQRSYVRVTVIGLEENNRYVIRYDEGPLAGQRGGNWTDSDLARVWGCSEHGLCVGDQVFNVARSTALAQITGIEYNGNHILRFLDGALVGQTGGHWGPGDLAITKGCGNRFCVGDWALNKSRNYVQVQVVGVQPLTGHYVLYFREGALAGQRGGNWGDGDLVRTRE